MAEIHICRGSGRHYRVRLHWRGDRKWLVEPTLFQSIHTAACHLGEKMGNNAAINRGGVISCADYYEPRSVLKMERP